MTTCTNNETTNRHRLKLGESYIRTCSFQTGNVIHHKTFAGYTLTSDSKINVSMTELNNSMDNNCCSQIDLARISEMRSRSEAWTADNTLIRTSIFTHGVLTEHWSNENDLRKLEYTSSLDARMVRLTILNDKCFLLVVDPDTKPITRTISSEESMLEYALTMSELFPVN